MLQWQSRASLQREALFVGWFRPLVLSEMIVMVIMADYVETDGSRIEMLEKRGSGRVSLGFVETAN